MFRQAIQVTCWGLNEDRRFIDDLSRKAELTSLTIEYRPRRNININRLNEITIYHRRLFLDHPYLKSLSIDMTHNAEGSVNDIVQMQPEEILPPIKSLSLRAYRFERAWQGLHVNLNVRFLQTLTLDSCRRLDFLFDELRVRKARLKGLMLRRPIWREGASSRERQRSSFQCFLDEQVFLEVLELESIGFSYSILHKLVRGEHEQKLKALQFRDLDHQLRTTTSDLTLGRTVDFKSISQQDLFYFRLRCLELTSLQIDPAGWDFDSVSQLLVRIMTLVDPGAEFYGRQRNLTIRPTETVVHHDASSHRVLYFNSRRHPSIRPRSLVSSPASPSRDRALGTL